MEHAFCGKYLPYFYRAYNLVLSLSTGVPFWFNIPLTVASAAVALSAAFLALGSGLFVEILKCRRFRHFLPLSSSEDDQSNDSESSIDYFSRNPRHRIFSPSGDSQTSSTYTELEALLNAMDETDVLGDSWAKNYLVTRLLWTFWYSCTAELVMKGFFLGLVFVTMHYSGSMFETIKCDLQQCLQSVSMDISSGITGLCFYLF